MKLDELKQIRKSRHLSRKDLATLSKIPSITIASLENGINHVENVKLSTLIALASALKVRVRAILPNELAKRL